MTCSTSPRRVVDRAKGGEQVEAFATHAHRHVGHGLRRRGRDPYLVRDPGGRVRVIVEGRLGFASTSDVSEDGLTYALQEARSNAAYGTADIGNVLPLPATPLTCHPLPSLVSEGFDDVPVARKVAMAVELERLTRAADSRGLRRCCVGLRRLAVPGRGGLDRRASTRASPVPTPMPMCPRWPGPVTRRRPGLACRWAAASAISTSAPPGAKEHCEPPGCSARSSRPPPAFRSDRPDGHRDVPRGAGRRVLGRVGAEGPIAARRQDRRAGRRHRTVNHRRRAAARGARLRPVRRRRRAHPAYGPGQQWRADGLAAQHRDRSPGR